MGLFGTKTKSEWDKTIMSYQTAIANAQGRLASHKATYGNKQPAIIAADKAQIAHLKAELANAKIQRKNAPKG